MNILKAIFISLLIPVLLGSTIYAIVEISSILQTECSKNNPAFNSVFSLIGVLLISLPFLLFFAKAMLFQNTARTSKLLSLNIFFIVVGFLLMVYSEFISASLFTKNLQNTFFGIKLMPSTFVGLANILLFVLYIFWYSKLHRLSKKLSIGQPLPPFDLYQKDELVSTQTLINKPTVFIFYRGNWCPFCIAQIKELSKAYDNAVHQGTQFVLVSPQPDQHSQNLAKKFNMPFLFLRDKENQAAKSLGILHKNGLPFGLQALGYSSDTVMPTVIATNKNGIIEYLDQTDNYRVRPEVNEFINLFVPQ